MTNKEIYFLAEAPTNPSEQMKNIDGSDTSLQGTILNVLNVVFVIIGIVAVIVIVVGGISYIVSNGSSEKVKGARNIIMYGIIGLIVTLFAFAIVNFVLSWMNGG